MVVGTKTPEKPKGRMYVRKRGGRTEPVHFDKITSRIQKLCYGLNMEFVDPAEITLQVINGLYTGVTTVELDNLAAETAATLTIHHPDYAILAARIAVSNLHKETKKQFSDVIVDLYEAVDDKTGEKAAMISDQHFEIITGNADRLNSSIIYDRDFYYNYFGFKTLESCYLMRINGRVAERPQHMLMRVAVGIHGTDIDAAIETYNLMSEKYFAHSEVVLNAAATPRQQLSSCYLLAMKDDSIEGIYDTLKECALVTKSVANIGMHIHCIRAHGTYIAGTNGTSNGIVPMLRVFNNVARHVFQGANKRPGELTVYLEPWHCDVFELLELPKSTGKEEVRARDLSFALWVPDLFMRRVEGGGLWSLMCPHDCPGLYDTWGDDFDRIYTKYESEGRFAKQVDAQSLWSAILDTQLQTGMPFMLYKDTCNRKSNQQNLGTVKCSNYTAENITYTSPDEVAALNEASIAVNMFVKPDRSYDFWKLKEVTKVITNNLNKIIDINNYPVPEARRSSQTHRPISIGVQGLADLFITLRLPFESAAAQHLNKQIFETIYYGALEASCELSEQGGTYDTYPGSPASKGVLQYDMWEATPTDSLWNWEDLKRRIAEHGLRNSLLVAPMPTDATAQILGNAVSFEPYSSYVQTCSVASGDFTVVNHHLLRDLVECGLWDHAVKSQLINNYGSVQNIPEVPDGLKVLYKTVWETSQKVIIKMAADRGAFIDQSQSLNIHIAEPSYGKLTSMHFHAWKMGLKTGMHYLRTKPVVKAIRLTLDPIKQKKTNVLEMARNVNTSNGTAKDSKDEQLRIRTTGLLTGEQG